MPKPDISLQISANTVEALNSIKRFSKSASSALFSLKAVAGAAVGVFAGRAAINGIKELREQFRNQHFTAAKKVARCLITLPIHSYVTQNDIARISAVISKVTNRDQ